MFLEDTSTSRRSRFGTVNSVCHLVFNTRCVQKIVEIYLFYFLYSLPLTNLFLYHQWCQNVYAALISIPAIRKIAGSQIWRVRRLESFSWNILQYVWWICYCIINGIKMASFQHRYQFPEEEKVAWNQVWRVGWSE